MGTLTLRISVLGLLAGALLAAQTADDTELKQVIIFGRHSVDRLLPLIAC
jgi:hypothetical protein